MIVRFTKMHGIGNDYVYVNGFEQTIDDPSVVARHISDRHRGVGADGLILLLPPDDRVDAHVRMRMFNADGSESQMCGNGIRCLCKLAHDRGICTENPMRIQTGRGVLELQYALNAEGLVDLVTVDMGQPILEPKNIPVNLPGNSIINHQIQDKIHWPKSIGDSWIEECGWDGTMTCVSMGNPHAVMFCDDVNQVPLEHVGPVIEQLEIFLERVNAHFVQIESRDEVTMRSWERGSGITLACGTGASAVCVASVLTNRTDRGIHIHLPGGDLQISWNDKTNHVEMTGPAVEIFSGEWNMVRPAVVSAR